jgi:transcription elongation factor Elf1
MWVELSFYCLNCNKTNNDFYYDKKNKVEKIKILCPECAKKYEIVIREKIEGWNDAKRKN